MALDFHNNANEEEYLFSLDNRQYSLLEEIITEFGRWTGIFLDQYGDCVINEGNQKTFIKMIEKYIQNSDLNANKEKTTEIFRFYSLLKYFSERGIEFSVLGD